MRRYYIGMLLLLLMGFSGPVDAAGDRHVRIVMSGSGGVYQEVVQAITAVLNASINPLPEISVDALPEGEDAFTPAINPNRPDVIVTVGVRAAQAVLREAGETPVFSVLIPKSTFATLLAEHKMRSGGKDAVSAIYLDQPFARQVDLARLILPRARRLGVLLGSHTLPDRAAYEAEAGKAGFELISARVTDERDAASAIRDLAEQVDVIVAVHDPAVLTPSTAKWLLYMAYQRQVPVIGFSKAYVTAGALASVYTTPEQIGRQAGSQLAEWLRQDPITLDASMYPANFSTVVNQAVADSMGVTATDTHMLTRMRGAE